MYSFIIVAILNEGIRDEYLIVTEDKLLEPQICIQVELTCLGKIVRTCDALQYHGRCTQQNNDFERSPENLFTAELL